MSHPRRYLSSRIRVRRVCVYLASIWLAKNIAPRILTLRCKSMYSPLTTLYTTLYTKCWTARSPWLLSAMASKKRCFTIREKSSFFLQFTSLWSGDFGDHVCCEWSTTFLRQWIWNPASPVIDLIQTRGWIQLWFLFIHLFNLEKLSACHILSW